jgi:hypothetical protein
MDKKEILNKSRNSSTDEGLEYFENKGLRIGYTAFYFVAIFMILFGKYYGKESHSVFTLLWLFTTVNTFIRFRFYHEKIYILFISLISFVFMINSFVSFILETMG